MQTFLRKYGVETIVNFSLFEVDGVDFRVDAVDGGTDCNIRKDQGADTTCTNDFVDEGIGYSLTIEAGEMEAKEITLYIIDGDGPVYLDEILKIETYGNASAQHALDLNDADGSTFTETGGDGAQLTAINLPNQTMDISGSLSGSVGSVSGAVGSVAGNVDGSVASVVGAVGSVSGDTKQTADNDTKLTTIASLLDDARGEPGQGAPAVNPDAMTKLDYIYKWIRNKKTSDADSVDYYNDAGAVVDQKRTISDDGSTFTEAEVVSGP